MNSSVSKPFNLLAGHPALELVNTLDLRFSSNPQDLIPSYADLLRFAAQLRLLTAEQARKLGRAVREDDGLRVLASTVELREALSTVLYAWVDGDKPADGQVEILETHFHAAALHRSLRGGDERLVWNWSGDLRDHVSALSPLRVGRMAGLHAQRLAGIAYHLGAGGRDANATALRPLAPEGRG